jgi:outer membrane protein TolC
MKTIPNHGPHSGIGAFVGMTMRRAAICLGFALGLVAAGCKQASPPSSVPSDDLGHSRAIATKIDYPDVETEGTAALETMSPLAIGPHSTPEYWDLSLEEAVKIGLENSVVMRDLGGLVLRAPAAVQTVQSPTITELDPRFGVEAALSAFDAQFSTSAFWEKNDRPLNNAFFGGGTRQLNQDVGTYRTQIAKRTAAGTSVAFRHNAGYDSNNAPANLFPSVWNTNFEAEIRQPLLLGSGVDFNRIAGPAGTPGLTTGVLIARVNTDVSLADFEAGVIQYLANVENAYWDLYYAYRELDARIAARNSALATWQKTHALYLAARRGGEANREAEAREQYFRFEEEVQNAWSGRLVEGSRTNNGSGGGTARFTGGVRVAERRMRLMMGIPVSEPRLIRPSQEPMVAPVVFDWDELVQEAVCRRVELRRQKWQVKRREMELVASRNFLLPTLDAVGQYRWRGFGHDLIDGGPLTTAGQRSFNSAFQDLGTLDFQEWQLGVEFAVPLSRRRAHVAVRNAELQLARERALLHEQERQVVHDLANAVGEVQRAFDVIQTSYNRREAARTGLTAVQEAFEADKVPLDAVLDAQRRLAEDEVRYYGALVDHAMAVKNVHYEAGSLLDFAQVYLSEGPWPGKAYGDAERRANRRRPASALLSYVMSPPLRVSRGTYAQSMAGINGPYFEEAVTPAPVDTDPPAMEPMVPDNVLPVPELPAPMGTAQPRPQLPLDAYRRDYLNQQTGGIGAGTLGVVPASGTMEGPRRLPPVR